MTNDRIKTFFNQKNVTKQQKLPFSQLIKCHSNENEVKKTYKKKRNVRNKMNQNRIIIFVANTLLCAGEIITYMYITVL